MIEFKVANNEIDFECIASLANTIWREHYIPIVGKPQIDYMLDKYQSVDAIDRQTSEGFEYFNIFFNKTPVGYISIRNEENALFLSKIYVLNSYRGKGIGKASLLFIESKTKCYNLNVIRLTVNKNNFKSIKAYEKLGFKILGPLITDIGNGFVMDDYEMIKKI